MHAWTVCRSTVGLVNITIYTEWILQNDRTMKRWGGFWHGSEYLYIQTRVPNKFLRSGARAQGSQPKSILYCKTTSLEYSNPKC